MKHIMAEETYESINLKRVLLVSSFTWRQVLMTWYEVLYNFVIMISSLAILFDIILKYRNMSQAKHWCFTLNNYTTANLTQLRNLGDKVSYVVFGRETGASGTPHLQGFVSFAKRTRRNQVIREIGQAHCTVARDVPRSIEYCKKDGDFEEFGTPPGGTGVRSDLESFKQDVKEGKLKSLDEVRECHSDVYAKYPRFAIEYFRQHSEKIVVDAFPLRQWQEDINQVLNREADRRKIVFVVDLVGNSGKSWYSHYYCSLHDDAQVLLPSKKADMAFALKATTRVLFIDAPRSKQGEFIQYDFLEDVKNGYVFSPKYESHSKYMQNKVHVVVMMNEMPDMSKLSQDRYHIIEV